MELKQFIVKTVQDIEGAFKQIQTENGSTYILSNKADSNQNISQSGIIDFDLAINISNSDETGGKAGILNVVSIGVNAKAASESIQMSRIKFQIKRADYND